MWSKMKHAYHVHRVTKRWRISFAPFVLVVGTVVAFNCDCIADCVIFFTYGRNHNTALRRSIVKIYDAAERIAEISCAIWHLTICSATSFLRCDAATQCCNLALTMRRRNAVLWPRPIYCFQENKWRLYLVCQKTSNTNVTLTQVLAYWSYLVSSINLN